MNNQIGIDSTGTWNPAQYAIDAGWDRSCIEATAAKGVSEADADGLTEARQRALLAYCQEVVAAAKGGELEYHVCTDAGTDTIYAATLEAAYEEARDKITDAMIEDGATLWVESPTGERITMDSDGTIL